MKIIPAAIKFAQKIFPKSLFSSQLSTPAPSQYPSESHSNNSIFSSMNFSLKDNYVLSLVPGPVIEIIQRLFDIFENLMNNTILSPRDKSAISFFSSRSRHYFLAFPFPTHSHYYDTPCSTNNIPTSSLTPHEFTLVRNLDCFVKSFEVYSILRKDFGNPQREWHAQETVEMILGDGIVEDALEGLDRLLTAIDTRITEEMNKGRVMKGKKSNSPGKKETPLLSSVRDAPTDWRGCFLFSSTQEKQDFLKTAVRCYKTQPWLKNLLKDMSFILELCYSIAVCGVLKVNKNIPPRVEFSMMHCAYLPYVRKGKDKGDDRDRFAQIIYRVFSLCYGLTLELGQKVPAMPINGEEVHGLMFYAANTLLNFFINFCRDIVKGYTLQPTSSSSSFNPSSPPLCLYEFVQTLQKSIRTDDVFSTIAWMILDNVTP